MSDGHFNVGENKIYILETSLKLTEHAGCALQIQTTVLFPMEPDLADKVRLF